jgi:hypothetical protein
LLADEYRIESFTEEENLHIQQIVEVLSCKLTVFSRNMLGRKFWHPLAIPEIFQVFIALL